jgi:hypothetical protein
MEAAVLISSAIFPNTQALYGTSPTLIQPELRLEQTKATIRSLVRLGYKEIYLADNSGPNWIAETEQHLRPAIVFRFDQRQFLNKGISELYLLLAALSQLPGDRPIVKLSGRYTLRRRLDERLGSADCVFKLHHRGGNYNYVSTIAYAVKTKSLFKDLLEQSLREVFAYSARIVGLRSLWRIVKHSIVPGRDDYPHHDPGTSIELAMERVLRMRRYSVSYVDELGVEGMLAQDGRFHSE